MNEPQGTTLKVGDAILTDQGSAFVADLRNGDDGTEVGFVIDGELVWSPAELVTQL